MVIDLLVAPVANSKPTIMENATLNLGLPAPPSPLISTSVHVALPSRSPSTLNLKGARSVDEAARSAVASFAQQQAPLIAAMFAQRLIHVSNKTGVDVEALHSHFVGEFLPSFLECLHNSMTTTSNVAAECCDMCNELGQRSAFLAACQTTMSPQLQSQLQQQTPMSSFQQRSNSVSFGSRGKNSPPLSLHDNSPCNPSLLASSLHTTSIYSLNNAPHAAHSAVNGTTVGSKFKHFLGQIVSSRRRRTISSTNNRDGNILPLASETSGLSSPALSLPVEVVIEGVLELHTRAPSGSTHTPFSSRSGLSNSKDLLTSIPASELEKDDEQESDSVSGGGVELHRSSEFLADSPWLPCHTRLVRSSAGPMLVLSYSPDINQPHCGISMSSISEVRAATIGDALTSDDHAFILISSSLSSRVLLKASSRAEMNRWLDALRPCVAFHPAAMVPLFPVNKFGLAVPSNNSPSATSNGLLAARLGGNLLGNIVGHFQQPDLPMTPKGGFGNSVGAGDGLSRSVSFVGRRRIQTSPAVDLQHMYKSNKGQKQDVEPETVVVSSVSAAASEIGGSRASSTDTASVTTPPRPLSPSSQCSQGSSAAATSKANANSTDTARLLTSFPWFWGDVSRAEAAEAVCKFGDRGNGCFVIRQSESQVGDYVITFNCDGEAKNLRFKVFQDGRCQMEQYAFPSVQALVDHFRTNALPFELGVSSSSYASGVMLTNYVTRRPMTPSSSSQPAVKG